MGKRKNRVQVSKEHYFENYDDLNRWISYWWQISLVRKLGKKKVMEIGIGNKTVSNYLKKAGFSVTTYDIDPELNPDYVGDITSLPFRNDSFEVLLCCEVLEHLQFAKAKKALKEINRVTKEYAVISVFAANVGTSFVFKLPYVKLIYKNVIMPMFWAKHRFQGEHYWELGKSNYSIKEFRKLIRNSGFRIVDEEYPVLNIYHNFFILRKIK